MVMNGVRGRGWGWGDSDDGVGVRSNEPLPCVYERVCYERAVYYE